MQNFELSVEENRIPHFYVFQNRNLKYRKILYAVHKKPCIFALLEFKLCRGGDMYTTKNRARLEKFDFIYDLLNASSVFVKFIMYQLLIDLHDYAALK